MTYRDEQIAARVASGANSSPESAAWSVDYGAGYAAGQSDARTLAYRAPIGANEAHNAGYEGGYAWTRDHMPASELRAAMSRCRTAATRPSAYRRAEECGNCLEPIEYTRDEYGVWAECGCDAGYVS